MRHTLARLGLILMALLTSGALAQARPAPQATTAAATRIFLPQISGAGAGRPLVRLTYDPARAASAAIGAAGGTVSATGADGTAYALSIPAGALDFTETITLTPALAASGLPFSGGLLGAVDIAPAGLELYLPAQLKITTARVNPALTPVGFATSADGSGFHLRPLGRAAGSGLAATLSELDLALLPPEPTGVAQGTPAEIAAQQAQPAPTDPAAAAAERLAGKASLIIEILPDIYRLVVAPQLQLALTDPLQTDLAVTRVSQWLAWVDALDARGSVIAEIADAKARLRQIIPQAGSAALERCVSQRRPEEGFRLLRYIRYARLFLDSAASNALTAQLQKCLTFKLTFRSNITALSAGKGYLYNLRSEVLLRATNEMRVVGDGPLNWVDFRYVGSTAPCVFNTSGTGAIFNATEPNLGLTFTPVSRTSAAVKLNLRYNPGKPTEHVTVTCPSGSVQMPTGVAWSTYFTNLHQYEFDESGINTTVTVTNVGTFTGWVYHHTGGPNGEVVEDTQIDLEHSPSH